MGLGVLILSSSAQLEGIRIRIKSSMPDLEEIGFREIRRSREFRMFRADWS